MRLEFLGTGTSTGVPVIGCQCETCQSTDRRDNRLRASVIWSVNGYNILVDPGPDLRIQLLRARATRIDCILVTHQHYDHVGGLDDVRGLNFSMGQSINVYAEPIVASAFRHNLSYIFAENKYPGVPEITLSEIDATSSFFPCEGLEIIPIRVFHGKLPIVGFRIGNWAYITDASSIPEESMKALQNLDVLVLNALRIEPHPSHFSLSESLSIVNELSPKRTYFTHASHHMPLQAVVERTLPDGVRIAYDCLVIEE
ncbi:MAG: MBL fold metallo-hydrolase [Marinilabiliaceae bacterium]|mgnify:CR=1 FL=1|nr:MBL fold metallo-hydrolase [Marinilabiliaceae bacterium]